MSAATDSLGAAVRMLRTAAGLSTRDLARRAHISPAYIGFIEHDTNAPSDRIAAALDTALGAGGLLRAAAREDDIVKRRTLFAALAAVAAGAGEYARLVDGVTRAPIARAGQTEVDAVASSVEFATDLDLRCGGGAAAGPGRAVLGWAVGLLDAEMTDRVRVDLSGAVAALADRVAWSHYDAGQDTAAQRLYGIALKISQAGADPNLRAHILLDESTRAAHRREYDRAATLLRGVVDAPGLLPAVRSNVALTYARHVACMGARREALEVTARAVDVIGEVDQGAEVPSWSRRFLSSPAHLRSVAARPLLFAGDYEAAVGGFTAALADLGPDRGRGRAYALALLGLAYLRAGYADRAEDTTLTLVGASAGLQSARVAGHMHSLAAELRAAGRRDLGRELAQAAAKVDPAQGLDSR